MQRKRFLCKCYKLKKLIINIHREANEAYSFLLAKERKSFKQSKTLKNIILLQKTQRRFEEKLRALCWLEEVSYEHRQRERKYIYIYMYTMALYIFCASSSLLLIGFDLGTSLVLFLLKNIK